MASDSSRFGQRDLESAGQIGRMNSSATSTDAGSRTDPRATDYQRIFSGKYSATSSS